MHPSGSFKVPGFSLLLIGLGNNLQHHLAGNLVKSALFGQYWYYKPYVCSFTPLSDE
jgi:hypothetical protein